ncbi:L-dopachrome tautomerase yellow-e3 isoform X2 [Haematobia irritans]|uniref:L-dopachrome tautomerase yellow-e3 isoform X2 n=1 Tax=Haematobia irritans TaxID=7368 RepID=UPI003F4F823C
MFGLAIALIYGCCLVSKDVVTEARLHQRNFFTLYKWTKGIEMTFPTEMVKDMALNAGYYDLNRIQLPVDIDIEYRDNNTFRTFLTIPRLNFGVPYSLATIISNDRGKQLNPKVESFPSYEWHHSHGTNCTGITSALRTYIDECRRLWVLDSGQIHSLQLCAPQILVFDLTSNELIERYVFPANNYKAGISVYTDMVADIPSRDDCKNTHLYVADAWGHGLIVYDMLRHKSWRIEHDLMKPDRTLINNVHDGIFTVSLSPKNRKLEGSRGTQCESEVMDSSGNLYCSLIGSNALVSWKENIPYSADNINVMAYSTEQWRFVTGLKLAMNLNDEEELWALSTEPKLFVGKGMRTKTTMYQIIGCRINNLHRNELCSVGTHDVKMM